ncbi:MAG: TadE family type IV pilus minor pilin [Rhodoglobus sp.]
MTAEFAVALPAVVLVLAACLTGMQVAGQQLRLADAAAHAARSLARGEAPDRAAARAAREVPGASITQWTDADLLCVTVTAPGALALTLTATSCALSAGR